MSVADPLPPAQQAIRNRCAHPTGLFVPMTRADIDQSIPSRFERQVEKHGPRPAVRTKDESLSYDDLNCAANRIARSIVARHGSPKGQRQVALLLENDAPMIAAMLGVLKAGQIYVPLDPSLPPARLAFLLRDSEATLIVTTQRLRERLAALFGNGSPWLDVDEVIHSGGDASNPGVSIPPDARTWILYTSGSTGQPKGTLQTHRNILHYVSNYTNGLRISADDRLLLLFSFGVNAAAHEIYSALLNGACLYPFDVRAQGPTRLAAWLLEHDLTMYSSVPTVFRHFCDGLTGTEQFPHLRVIKLLGEPVAPRDVRSFQRNFSADCVLVNRLGSTETGGIRWNFLDRSTPVDDRYVPVGFAVDDNEILLLDDRGEPVPPGEVGEIVVSSPYLSPGYWRNVDATANAFSLDPRGGAWRRYRTGDLGRIQPDRSLVHLGRKDSQVKILGHRVELGEIEAVCAALPGVHEVVVAARRDPNGELRLVAYLLRAVADGASVREALRARLPAHMVPSQFVLLDRFPVAQNGKVNRGALPEPDWSNPALENRYVAPRTPLERELASLWASALAVDRVGVEDNFFDLGGHSLVALRLLGQIERQFGKQLAMASLLESPTVAGIARILSDDDAASPFSSLAVLQARGSKPPFFWVHGARSNAFLGRFLGADQPLYGLLQQSRDGARPRHTRIEEIAAFYLAELRRMQPEGPYFLGGYCVGATLAFEMAQQIHAAGATVGLLLLLDPPSPNGSRRRRTPRPALAPGSLWRRTKSRAKEALAATAEAAKEAACWFHLKAGLTRPIPVALRARYINVVHTRARQEYAAAPYRGEIVVLTTEDIVDASIGWRELADGRCDVHRVQARHDEVVFQQSSIEVLATHLKTCLERAQAAHIPSATTSPSTPAAMNPAF